MISRIRKWIEEYRYETWREMLEESRSDAVRLNNTSPDIDDMMARLIDGGFVSHFSVSR